ncbi:hypothetical protein D9M68_20270 [compost metagenome]
MNPFVSLEEALNPIGTDKAPDVGLLVHDWDENVNDVAAQIYNAGRSVTIIPTSSATSSMESSVNGIIKEDKIHMGVMPATLFYYKGLPEDAQEGIPVLTVENGKVQVSHEGRVKELAEALGLLEDRDDTGDHEYR